MSERGMLARLRARHPLARLQQNRAVAAVLRRLDVPVYRRLHGVGVPVRVRLIRDFAQIVDGRLVEPEITALILTLGRLLPVRVFWDVGAYAGYYSLMLLHHDPDVRCEMFEPDPGNAELIRATLRRSPLERATLHEVALAEEPGSRPFRTDPITGKSGTISTGTTFLESRFGVSVSPTTTVATTSADHFLADHDPPDLVKIDVEGAEHLVLAGAGRLLSEARPVVIVECFDGTDAAALASLRAEGYELYDADDCRLPAPRKATSNYLALPKERDLVKALRAALTDAGSTP